MPAPATVILLMLAFLPTLYITVFGGKWDTAAPAKATSLAPARTGAIAKP